MAGSSGVKLAVAVSKAGGLGSLPCAILNPDQIRQAVAAFRAASPRPLNLNFFAHAEPKVESAREAAWTERLRPWFEDFGLPPPAAGAGRATIDEAHSKLLEERRPEIVSCHFCLPDAGLFSRVQASGARIMC
jgi:nitronate monooxygenase